MPWFSKADLAALLERERPLLDRIFGEAPYQIHSIGPRAASVRSSSLQLEIGEDPRDGLLGSTLTVIQPWGEEDDPLHVWARFLEEESSPLPRSTSGHVTLSREEQLRAELSTVARLATVVFSDPHKTRDAANFVRGYRTAYNDWASGAWGAR